MHSAGLGQGSHFTVLLPLSFQAPEPVEAAYEGVTGGQLVGLKILLVDDSSEVLDALTHLLEMEAANVHAFADPHKALEAATDDTYDLRHRHARYEWP